MSKRFENSDLTKFYHNILRNSTLHYDVEKARTAFVIVVIITAFGVTGAFIGLQFRPESDNGIDTTTTTTTTSPDTPPLLITPSSFSEYIEYTVNYILQAPQYELESNLSNIVNLEEFQNLVFWNSEVAGMISNNYFAAIAQKEKRQFSEIYEENNKKKIPSFVTTDAVLHAYHVMYDAILRTIETNNLTDLLYDLSQHIVQISLNQYTDLEEGRWKDSAKKNVAFFSIAVKLLDPDWSVPSIVEEWVESVLSLINAYGQSRLPFMEYFEDFSQYIPRGHYTKSETLKRYFKTMMWFGRIPFRINSRDETAQAILLSLAMREPSSILLPAGAALERWFQIYDTTCFFVGTSDDLAPYEYLEISDTVYGENPSLESLQNEDRLTLFIELARTCRDPEILSSYRAVTLDEDKGLRFMGQRYVPDSEIFQELSGRDIRIPQALHIMYVLGSNRSEEHLRNNNSFTGYAMKLSELRTRFENLTRSTWTQNLYWLWLYSMKPLLSSPREGQPSFMLRDKWTDKQLVTSLGTWTELRHDTILYSKQSYNPRSGSHHYDKEKRGYVEPNPEVYARLASLCRMMIKGLDSRSLLDLRMKNALDDLHFHLRAFQSISEKELSNIVLNDTEVNLINQTYKVLSEIEGIGEEEGLAPLVADVHTNPNSGMVLHEATGYPMELYVVVPNEYGEPYLTRGAMYSHYEFTIENNRLTDELWWKILNDGEEPPLADWMLSFVIHPYYPPENGPPLTISWYVTSIISLKKINKLIFFPAEY